MVTLTLLLSVSAVNVSSVRVIKIGYAPNYGIIGDINDSGNEGYGYEYLNKIIQHTKGNYILEFVECGFMNGYEMLQKGLIDILAPLPTGAGSATDFVFSKNPIGQNATFLIALDQEHTKSYELLEGSTIAVQKYYAETTTLLPFLKQYNINANVVEMNMNSVLVDPELVDFDYILTSSLQLEGDLDIITKLDSTDVHLMSTINNADLMADLDYGIEQIRKHEYLYEERLNLKYYDYSVSNDRHVTQEEYELIQSQGTFRVGYSPAYDPLTYIDSSGNLVGVAIDVLEIISEDAGIQFEMVDVTNPNVDLDSLDWSLMAPAFSNGKFAQVQSNPYYYYPYILVERNLTTSSDNLGLLGFYEIPRSTMSRLTNNGEEIIFQNYAAMEAAFNAGEIDRIIMTSVMYNGVRSEMLANKYNMTPISAALDVLIAFRDDFPPELVTIVNKFIARLDENQVEYSFSEHTNVYVPQTLGQFLEDNPVLLRILAGFAIGVAMMVFILEQKQQQKLIKLINYDELTGLYSERKFRDITHELLQNNPDINYTILSIDIDNFKHVNEIYGYEKGSQVIAKMGEFMAKFGNENLPIARGLSDSFLLLLNTDHALEHIHEGLKNGDDFSAMLNQVLDDDEDEDDNGHDEYNFSFSMGYYNITDRELDLSLMIDCAEIARDKSKRIIGTTLNEFTDDMSKERDAMNEVVTNMNKGIVNKEFQVYYQPKVDLQTEEIVGAEALVRWHKDDSKIVPPSSFIDIFEKNGFIEHLDYYIVNSVCDFISKNSDKKIPVISLNLSGITIMQDDLVDKLMGIVKAHNIEPCRIDLEITESAFIDASDLGIDKLDKLRELGFLISMDDFGAGVSSLNRLKEIPLDILKIDREFIVDSLENEKGSTIISSIISMAKNLKIETIAEGIETQEQYHLLKELGCDIGQGYFFSRPLQSEHFLRKLPNKT